MEKGRKEGKIIASNIDANMVALIDLKMRFFLDMTGTVIMSLFM